MNKIAANEPSKLQVAICALYIFAFLAAIAYCSQPYDTKLRPYYLGVAAALVVTVLMSQYRRVMVSGGLAMLAFRCIIGIVTFPQHALTFIAVGVIAACSAWFLFKTAVRRDRI